MNGLAWDFGALAVLLAVLWWRYLTWKHRSLERLAAASRIAQTPCGPVEYAEAGSGPAMVVCHGALGGYDQGLLLARFFRDLPFRLIAVSRPGYLRTPLASGASPEQQADAIAALLGALGIEKAVAVGISAGGPPVLQFALRHPNACVGLVLLSAVTERLAVRRRPSRWVLWFLAHVLDFASWLAALLSRWRPQWVLRPLGNAHDLAGPHDVETTTSLEAMVSSLVPVEPRWAGLLNDADSLATLPAYPLGRIRVPTLVVHGTADAIVPFTHAQFAAGAIPGAELVAIQGGSHLATLVNGGMVGRRALAFLAAHTPTA